MPFSPPCWIFADVRALTPLRADAAAADLPAGLRVHWVIPGEPGAEWLQALPEGVLSRRLNGGLDLAVPFHAAGREHRLLFPAERVRDLAWGAEDAFLGGDRPLILTQADPDTPTTRDWIEAPQSGRSWVWVCLKGEVGILPLRRASAGGRQDLVWWDPQEALPKAWPRGSRLWPAQKPRPHTPPPPLRPPLTGGLKARAVALGRARLEGFAEARSAGLFELPPGGRRALPPIPRDTGLAPGLKVRTLVADMQGQTSFRTGLLKAHFDLGRLTTLEGPGHTGRAEAFLEQAGRRLRSKMLGAYSLEGERLWGLRQSLIWEDPSLAAPGTLAADWFFLQDEDRLGVSVSLRWPEFLAHSPPLNGGGALEWELARLSPWQAVDVSVDGSAWRPLRRDGGILKGQDFRFRLPAGVFRLTYPVSTGYRIYELPFRWKRSWRSARLFINPEGWYGPIDPAELSGTEEHFSLLAGWEDAQARRNDPVWEPEFLPDFYRLKPRPATPR